MAAGDLRGRRKAPWLGVVSTQVWRSVNVHAQLPCRLGSQWKPASASPGREWKR